jgi:hypothetical protein
VQAASAKDVVVELITTIMLVITAMIVSIVTP